MAGDDSEPGPVVPLPLGHVQQQALYRQNRVRQSFITSLGVCITT